MKNLSHYLPVALMTLLLLLLLVGSACDEKSSIVESVGTPAPDPPFELDPAAEPPIKTSKFVVLSHSRYLFYNLAKEIRGYYNAALLHINDNTTAEITVKLNRIQPEYAIVVLPPHQIKPDVVANLFLSFCSLDDDVDLDLGYGYITGYTLEDARNLFYRTKNDTIEVGSFLGVSQASLEMVAVAPQ